MGDEVPDGRPLALQFMQRSAIKVGKTDQLTRLKGGVADMEVNRSGAAVGLYTEYLQTGADFDAVVRVVSRPADVRPATVRVAVFLGASDARIRAHCDEPCRLRARVGGQSGAAATRRPPTLTLRAHRRGSLRVRPNSSRLRAPPSAAST